MSDMWATFSLAGDLFALSVADVQEVLTRQSFTPVPLAPAHVVGLLNLRGQIIPAIDLRQLLGFPAGESWSALLVLRRGDRLLSIAVDEIGDVLELASDGWQPPPDTLDPRYRRFVERIHPIDGRLVLGIDASALSDDNTAMAQGA